MSRVTLALTLPDKAEDAKFVAVAIPHLWGQPLRVQDATHLLRFTLDGMPVSARSQAALDAATVDVVRYRRR
jgi:hypothetical protein